MRWTTRSRTLRGLSLAALIAATVGSATAHAAEAEAKALLKAMSDYLGAQKNISLDYDTTFEIVTTDKQKIQIAASGEVQLSRPDKMRATRKGGFADIEMILNGPTFTVFGKNANAYLQAPVPGTIEEDINEIREKLHRALPGADLLAGDVYGTLMDGVTDVKDLGAGVINGKTCDHLAFRAKDLDFQIWIAQGAEPYPCRYVITTTDVAMAPEYSITISNFKTGDSAVAANVFDFTPPAGATKIDPADVKAAAGLGDLPPNAKLGE
ncbi:MAG: DUF2092 domain-containing protein [Hyphomicrobiales bacterium]